MTESKLWNVVENQRLTKLFNNGLSYARIAEQLGTRSKSSVAGRVQRLGLVAKKSPLPLKSQVKTSRIHTCQWPYGDPRSDDFYFCGKPALEGKSWCPDHYIRVYQTPKDEE